MFQKILKFLSPKIIVEIILLALSVWMGIYFQWEAANLVFFVLFVILIIHPISSRIPAVFAIALLVATALLLVFKKEDWAEISAIWAYYAMTLIVAMAMYELKAESLSTKKGEDISNN